MKPNPVSADDWDVIDERAVRDLVSRKGAADLMNALISSSPSPRGRADRLIEAATAGRLKGLAEETQSFRDWADQHGLRRLANALVELDRVLDLPERGKAILHAQALTRFISRHVDGDVERLREIIKGG